MLEIHNLRAGYDSGEVLHGIDLVVEEGSIVALVGANGAGKSTTLKAVSGLIARSGGDVVADGMVLKSGAANGAVRAGIAHVPEGRQVFANLTVKDNLILGGYLSRKRLPAALDSVLEIFPVLHTYLHAYAGSLSGGQQQMLAIARGLVSEPRYLLFDEPSLGLAPTVVQRIFEVIETVREQGRGILLVEQNGRLALSIAQHAHLLESGRITISGTGAELLENREVIDRYLGVGSDSLLGEDDQARVRELATALAATQRESPLAW